MNFFKNATFRRGLVIGLIIVLTAGAAFGLGRLSVLMGEKEPLVVEEPPPLGNLASAPPVSTPSQIKTLKPEIQVPATLSQPTSSSATFVGSRTGKSYYFPWCGIVKRIKKENLVSFKSKAEAEAAGYSPGNCAGLK